MRQTSSKSIKSAKVFWTTLLACCLQVTFIDIAQAEASANPKVDDDSFQMDNEMPKRDWNRNLNTWGKRGWSNIHGGWALKRSAPSWVDQQIYPSVPIAEKRSWQNFQGGWGKRMAPSSEEEAAMQEVAAMLEQQDPNSIPMDPEEDFAMKEEDKRNWNKFSDGWGKRTKWENFRGSWGKRSPAWSNLKGVWGKRSERNSP
ncbi:unnamed protein product [Phaedon cochleariae]|uniref:Uncharacterized protein n=1 Tax=Phaedon cochleariae TaxID=80249 RepID=A0A9P0GPV7_PHACE|nr:unnamed protein product [Phaedon cochleariae]